ncbi:hypothetical protein [Kribbella deserti]|uniref:Uncharacterized protein n=1 Tax=Kribbella deserti TaxID=1926257 RepID=A0ABV6QMN7_9ACTN
MTADIARRLVVLLRLLERPSGGVAEDDELLDAWFGAASAFSQDG